ncbi:MAG: SPOR domain-containing protein [Spirochaetia bacterium]|nr:SPOR domain-containing protein [Spirochaetia bacterium]
MANRAYLWVVFTITLVCTVAAGAGLVYYYPRQETPQETPQETRVAAEPAPEQTPQVPEPVAVPEPVTEEPVLQPAEPVVEPQPAEPSEPEPVQEPEAVPEPEPEVVLPDADIYYWVLIEAAPTTEDANQIVEGLRELEIRNVTVRNNDTSHEVLVGPYIVLDEAEFTATRLSQIEDFSESFVKIELNR